MKSKPSTSARLRKKAVALYEKQAEYVASVLQRNTPRLTAYLLTLNQSIHENKPINWETVAYKVYLLLTLGCVCKL